jgi:hypothetical protein
LTGAQKAMIWVYFSYSGIGSLVLLPSQETPNHMFLVEKVLADFEEERAQNLPKNQSRGIRIHLDNAKPHRAPRDFDRLEITRLPHLPYNQNLIPCDCTLSISFQKEKYLMQCIMSNIFWSQFLLCVQNLDSIISSFM